ncbi:MAG: thioredoxin-disulfide reductase [Candidatus Glassbacteria bacterium RIFCSPLOWO2_12_FULL_58_11]|uniref:Thioredoxin reductase n=2 Tax=Candidatus Glassiibacteriota TaxID=1817805 RepID=A0A1F5YL06_9BACT|nr:MAG: thioredoxin-disulfide reductase [Candidatus Glassbacteria bacterium GWA2_58_10]OGG00879.1 MAG: thioredoxin-disulfide reductase [Candidatus Glassbacteria bacterium RIFCSPLOWO2_12_FULL_58_11]
MSRAENHFRQIIIGSGAAGLTAAIYSARAALRPVVFEGSQPGGQLTTTTEVENFPGFEEGILGPQLMEVMKKQALRFGAEFLSRDVEKADFRQGALAVVAGGESYSADSVIIATGAAPRMLGLANEKKFIGRGVSTCATCDAFFYRGKKVVVVGGGDSAMEEASFISKFASQVTLVHRRKEFRASKIMQDRIFGIKNITVIWDTLVTDIIGDDKAGVTALRLKNVKTGRESDFPTDGFFLAIGHTPNSRAFAGQIELDDQGYILTREGTATSAPGVFAAGDVVDHHYRQAITAAGMGCMASLDAEKYLAALKK